MLIVSSLVAAVSLMAPVAEKWEIKPEFKPKSKVSYELLVQVQAPDGEHEARLNMSRVMGESKDGLFNCTYTWEGLEVDGVQMGDDPSWDLALDQMAVPVSTTASEGDDIRRMFSPMAFVYPTSPVGEGDTWTTEIRPFKGRDTLKLTYRCEAKGLEKIGDQEALKVAVALKEEGTDGMSSEGVWWVARNGAILKFEIKISNWTVPMAGEAFDATVFGKVREKGPGR